MSISFLFVFSNVSVCSAHLIISFHPSSDLLTTTTSRDRLFSPLVANQTVVHLRRRSILCNSPLHAYIHMSLRGGSCLSLRGFCLGGFVRGFVWKILSGVYFSVPSRCQNTSVTTER